MKIISWNCNGLRSVNRKTKDGKPILTPTNENVIESMIREQEPDIVCLGEIKCDGLHVSELERYKARFPYIYANYSSLRRGYSGVAIMSSIRPKNVFYDFQNGSNENFMKEGRIVTLEFDKFFLVNVYVPNSKTKLERLDQRTQAWEPMFRMFVNSLQKSVVVTGDLNVAHENIDIFNPKGHSKSAGFTPEERQQFKLLLKECNMIDTYRTLHASKKEFTYFSNMSRAREKNNGWRIDYFLVSARIKNQVVDSSICNEYFGSDHVPVLLRLK
jgi:exodeoxyribonuclease-3